MATESYLKNQTVQKYRWLILVATGLFTFMSTLDSSIVNVALPVISRDLKVQMNRAEWVVSIYLIVICALLLLFGKLGDSLGKVRVFKLGTYLFVIGSFMAGFKWSFALLLAARVIQALGASMTMATSNGIVSEVFPLAERGRALGMIGSFVALGSITGPGVGGIVLAHFSWGFIFWINVPVGIITILIGHFVLPKDLTQSHEAIDRSGVTSMALLVVTFFTAIFLAQEYGYRYRPVIVLFAIAAVTAIWFGITETHQTKPLLSFALFKNSAFSVSLLCGFLIFINNFFYTAITPFYLENARALSPNDAGYILMISPIVQVVVAPIAGSLSDRIGPEKITLIGLCCILLTQVGFMTTTMSTPFWLFAANIALLGLGNGSFQAPNNTIVMNAVEPKDLGVAGGMNALARNLGMVIGIAISTSVLFAGMSHKIGHHVTTYIYGRPDIFIYGMHVAFAVAIGICGLATLITLYRVIAAEVVKRRA
ncbi:MFS transporter [Secundilactobacillus paracollinoides]|uniref:Multidrug MFS transporter n=1 Tax=Secundilactobacillus paracollinoides TaxID=240427 RepID=A0A1B2IYU1_9LACO|nr:MFS transporter [Secundilactobacillus paracollinoides]ANZ61291.1 multidrug MFS transporter [Secundilactobacillus paracollinoides]ANZ67213.1 multidrug MFS transporter [Secundilactobacillus paracollinoides]